MFIDARIGDRIRIGEDVVLTILDIEGSKVRFILECPDPVPPEAARMGVASTLRLNNRERFRLRRSVG